ncbi:MAG TPA: hypothetical protein VNI77_11325 [Nitrososphaera sp.]|nr:hypothetical protein [Nitrososphaera sp.]
MKKELPMKDRLINFAGKYWWLFVAAAIVGFFFTDIPIFTYIIYAIAVFVGLLILGPILLQLLAPSYILITSLVDHFKTAEEISFGKKYFFIPSSLLSATAFLLAHIILTLQVGVSAFVIWVDAIGFFWTFLGFFFGLAPLGIIIAPFLVWYQDGFASFLAVVVFFLMAAFWFAFSKMAFAEDYSSTQEDYLGYSPHIFLLGALSLQVIAVMFYHYDLATVGEVLSDVVGGVLLLLALIAAFKWRNLKKHLSPEALNSLYRPSGWIYLLGFFFTNILYSTFNRYEAPTAVLFWLNLFFIVGIVNRVINYFRHKRTPQEVTYEIENQ